MKSALILEKDPASRKKIAELMGWLGYVVAPVSTPEQALNVAGALRFEVIVTSMVRRPDDRRVLTGELKRWAPESAIVFIAENDADYLKAKAGRYAGVSAVIQRPATVEALRRVVECQVDGFGSHSICITLEHERRKN